MKTIDHLVYCVPDLTLAIQQFKNDFGIEPIYGGRHLDQGTHNALLNIGNECYFELLAPDPENRVIQAPRWMGIDLITKPKMTRWGIKTNQMSKDLKILEKINPRLATSKTGMRQKTDGSILNWELSLPLGQPEVEPVPFLIDWQKSEHPTKSMPQECELISFIIHHPQPTQFSEILKSLDIFIEIKKSNKVKLSTQLKTSSGQVVLIE